MKHIAIVGNIGSGKTTLTRKIAEHFGWDAAFESADDNPYLEDFYADMKKWAFHLQIYFLNSRFQQVKRINENETPIVQDRTIYEDAHIFARNLHLSEILNNRDYENYRAIYESITDAVSPPDLLIYLRADLPKLFEQIRKRGRGYETAMEASYLQSLNDLYEDWIANYKHGKVLIFDMNTIDFVANEEHFHAIIDSITNSKHSNLVVG